MVRNWRRLSRRYSLQNQQADCQKSLAICLGIVGTNAVSLYEGILGDTRSVEVDETYDTCQNILPIDTLVVDLTRAVEKDQEKFKIENVQLTID